MSKIKFAAEVLRVEMNDEGAEGFFPEEIEHEATDIVAAKAELIEQGYDVLRIEPALRMI